MRAKSLISEVKKVSKISKIIADKPVGMEKKRMLKQISSKRERLKDK